MTFTLTYPAAVRRACWLAFAVAVIVNLYVWLQPRGAALGNGHAFRQFQTALTTRYLVRDGWKIDYETPVLGPPWSVPMEFPLYQYTVAATTRVTGASLEAAGRAVAMGYFWAAVLAVWLLLHAWGVGRETRLLTAALLLTCPLYLFYGRHFMIETTALALGLWFLWAFLRHLQTERPGYAALAAALAAAGSLAKVTTFFGFGFAAALLLAAEIRLRPTDWRRRLIAGALIMLPAFVLTLLWVRHADALKAQNPIGDFLTSARLHTFNFGEWGQRIDAGVWQKIYEVTEARIASEFLLALSLVGVALAPPARRWLAGGSLVCFVAALGVFTNLFFVHDYYFEATAVFLIGAVALGLEGILTHSPLPPLLRASLVALLLTVQVAAFWREYGGEFRKPPPGPPAVAAVLDRLTDPEEVIVVVGQDWNARLPYYSDRRALMIPAGFEQNRAALQKSAALMGKRRVGAMVVSGDFRDHARVVVGLSRIFQVTPRPIVAGDGAQIYLPLDRLAELSRRLTDRDAAGFTVKRDYDPAKDILNAERDTDLTTGEWQGKFPMASPAPVRATGIYPPSFADRNGVTVIATHAPNSLHFQPAPGTRHLVAVGGMFPGSYEGRDHTDGVVVEVWESLPDGNQRLHFQRSLYPYENPADRGEFTIEVKAESPFIGPLYLRVDPGPAESINYDWLYWRSVKID